MGAYEFREPDGNLSRAVGTAGSPIDPHDMVVLPDGNRVMLTYEIVRGLDLSPLGAAFANLSTIVASHLQELTPDGQVVIQARQERQRSMCLTVSAVTLLPPESISLIK